MKTTFHKQTFNSFGFLLSCDTILRQWEPYEATQHFEPYLSIYCGKRSLRILFAEVKPYTRLGRWFQRQRDHQDWA